MSIQITAWNDLIEHDPRISSIKRQLHSYKLTVAEPSELQERSDCCCLVHNPKSHDPMPGTARDIQNPHK